MLCGEREALHGMPRPTMLSDGTGSVPTGASRTEMRSSAERK